MMDWLVRVVLLLACLLAGNASLIAQETQPLSDDLSLPDLLHAHQAAAANHQSSIELTLKFYNDEFLIDPMAPQPESRLVDPTHLRTIVSGNRIRIEGYSFPLVYVKPENSFSATSEPRHLYFADRAARAEGWQEALNTRFTKPVLFPERQQTVIVSDQKTLTQFWKSDAQNYPKAVVFPVDNLLDRRLPVEHLLVELMARPERLTNTVLKLIEGREFRPKESLASLPQILFEENVNEKAAIKQPIRIFLDPQRQQAITRVVIPETDGYRQYDVMFEDTPEKSSLPTRCSVYVGASNGDVLGYAEITRLTSRPLERIPSRDFEVEFPAGTYLADFTVKNKDKTVELAFVNEDRTRTVIDRKHLWNPDVTYEQLLAADHSDTEKKAKDFRQYRSQRRWLTTLLRWPWNLVTVVGLVVVGGIIRQGYKTLTAFSSKPEGDQI